MLNKINILFVDDQPNVLQGLKRSLRSERKSWDMVFSSSGSEALELMKERSFDVIVSDMKMPGMDGAQLLNKVKSLYPGTIRFILSGYSEKEQFVKSAGVVHQWLSKPCDSQILKSSVMRACQLRGLLSNTVLKEAVLKVGAIPTLPETYAEIMQEMQSAEVSLQRIGQLIGKDLGLTVRLLKLANSAFFGLNRSIATAEQAVILLGLDTTNALILSSQIFSQYDEKTVQASHLSNLWSDSLLISKLAKYIAQKEGCSKSIIEDSAVAGMLHDIGRLILASNMPREYEKVMTLQREEGYSLCEAEKKVIQINHAEIGAYLFGIWGLSDNIIEAIAYHHTPSQCSYQGFSALTSVYLASYIVSGSQTSEQLNIDYLSQFDCINRLENYRQVYHQFLEEALNPY